MKKLIAILILLLTGCSFYDQEKIESGDLLLSADEDTTANFLGKDYFIKANTIEVIENKIIGRNYTIQARTPNSYQTDNTCRAGEICNLKTDKKGKVNIHRTNETHFNITFDGLIREPRFCISYSEIWFYKVNGAIETDIRPHQKAYFDHCYIAEEKEFSLDFEGEGEIEVKGFLKE